MKKYLLVIAVLFMGLSASTALASVDSSSRANGPICVQLPPNHPESCPCLGVPEQYLQACYKQFIVTKHLPTPTPEPTVMPSNGEATYQGVLRQLIDVMIRLRALLMTQIQACERKFLPLSASGPKLMTRIGGGEKSLRMFLAT
jgi:hypothetical protein